MLTAALLATAALLFLFLPVAYKRSNEIAGTGKSLRVQVQWGG